MRLPLLSLAIVPTLLLLPSCVGAPEQPRAPAAGPAQQPAPRPAAPGVPAPPAAPVEWQYRPATPGDWTYRAEGGGSAASFGSPGTGPLLTFRCDPVAARISVARTGAGQGAMTIRTSYGAVSWPAIATGGQLVATRAANDAVLDQIAYSRGHFAVEVAGLATLTLPNWAEVSRVIEDCRR